MLPPLQAGRAPKTINLRDQLSVYAAIQCELGRHSLSRDWGRDDEKKKLVKKMYLDPKPYLGFICFTM